MKYAIVIPDGCADLPLAALAGKTPLQAARVPNMDRVALANVGGDRGAQGVQLSLEFAELNRRQCSFVHG